MKTRLLAIVGAFILLFLAAVPPAGADGIIVPSPPPDMPVVLPFLDIKYQRVEVTINDQVAITRVDQVFLNGSDRDLEGTYIFPLPQDAAISRFVMWADGKPLEGKVLDKEEARRIYEGIVSQRRDPALLEYLGRGAFQARVFPIPAHGEKRIQLEYSQLLSAQGGLVSYRYPLTTGRLSPRPIKEVTITVSIRSRGAIKAVYSPSHAIAVSRPDDHTAVASYEASDVTPAQDFQLYYTTSEDDFGLNLLAYQEKEGEGFFLLLLAPPLQVPAGEVVAKDVVLVLDTSGSMRGEKLEQAKGALRFTLKSLQAQDRFNIITFSSAVGAYAPALEPASAREKALAYVNGLQAAGGTNINDALHLALNEGEAGRPYFVIFLTDGLPTVGETDTARILANTQQAARGLVRLFTFGVGDDVNTILLDRLAQENGGASEYVRPGEDLEAKVSAFFRKVGSPVLADVSLGFQGVTVKDLYPTALPDLFLGSQLIVAGRYTGSGPVKVTLTGKVDGQGKAFTYPEVKLTPESKETAFIPRLWAQRKLGYLLDQVRLHGADKEVIDEIVALSLRYGIVTPYTSFLVLEDKPVLGPEAKGEAAQRLYQVMATPAPVAGAAAVDSSQWLQTMRGSEVVGASTPPAVRVAGDKVFLRQQGVWTDTTYPAGAQPQRLQFGSEEYYRVLAQHPEWGAYFAVGEQVKVALEGKAYEIGTAPVTPPAKGFWSRLVDGIGAALKRWASYFRRVL